MNMPRRSFLKVCTASGAILGLAPVAASKTVKPTRIAFPPGTIVRLDTYISPTGKLHHAPAPWSTLEFRVTCNGCDVTRLMITEVFVGPGGHVRYYQSPWKLNDAGTSVLCGIRRGDVIFSYRPPGSRGLAK
jgi:hypothetical protein